MKLEYPIDYLAEGCGVTLRDLAVLLDVSYGTVKTWNKEGVVPRKYIDHLVYLAGMNNNKTLVQELQDSKGRRI